MSPPSWKAGVVTVSLAPPLAGNSTRALGWGEGGRRPRAGRPERRDAAAIMVFMAFPLSMALICGARILADFPAGMESGYLGKSLASMPDPATKISGLSDHKRRHPARARGEGFDAVRFATAEAAPRNREGLRRLIWPPAVMATWTGWRPRNGTRRSPSLVGRSEKRGGAGTELRARA